MVVKYNTQIGNYLSNRMRWYENTMKYQHIYFDLQDVPIEHRQTIIDDIPLSLYSYEDTCHMEVMGREKNSVHIHIQYATYTKLVDEKNTLYIKLIFEDVIGDEYCKYLYHIYVGDTYKTISEYHVYPLGEDLHLPKDWFERRDYRTRIDAIVSDCNNENNLKERMEDSIKFVETQYDVNDIVLRTITVYDVKYYDTYINV